ncbi:hypothetical protein OUZ56_012539 [Daphnia magna]|uniref:Uncharacterized protein n=1 Tax=Daphnia magna TaxID=35525 RepID=A0ABQ9Z3B5_9CRUS|nr:hypothetical protein OUZ56_012539 [Daphnia magna]
MKDDNAIQKVSIMPTFLRLVIKINVHRLKSAAVAAALSLSLALNKVMGYETRSSSIDYSTKNGKNTEQTKKRKPEKNLSEESSCPDDYESEKSSDKEDERPKTPTKKRTDISEKNNSDSWAVARTLLRKAVEKYDINTETDSARTSKRKRTPKIPYSPNQSSADGEDSDDKTDSAQGEKQKRKISNQAKKLKLTARSQKPKKDECRDFSPLRDFDDLSNSENGEETDVPLKKQTNKVQSTTTHSDQSYTNEKDEPLMEDISNQDLKK